MSSSNDNIFDWIAMNLILKYDIHYQAIGENLLYLWEEFILSTYLKWLKNKLSATEHR